MNKNLKPAKTKAKRIGLKSTLVFDDKIVISSFADSKPQKSDGARKDLAPNVEKVTQLNGREIASNLRLFESVNVDEKQVSIRSRIHKEEGEVKYANPVRLEYGVAEAFDSPAKYVIGQDYIGVKSAIEKKYFGKEFENDNARVQIGYNIADIKKILTLYINNVTYMFYHLAEFEIEEDDDGNAKNDIIGMLPFYKTFDEQKDDIKALIKKLFKGLNSYREYFDGAFKKPAKDEEISKHNYEVLCLLSVIRQACMHSTVRISDSESVASDALLYRANDVLPQNLCDRLDGIYNVFTENLKINFANNSANNMYILKQIYDGRLSAEDLGKEYFNFALLKEQNNIGVNLKLIREIIIDSKLSYLRNDEYNSYRSKLYKILDFVLLHYLAINDDKTIVNEMINELRFCKDDKEKDEVYIKYADSIYKGCGKLLNAGISAVEKEAETEFKTQTNQIDKNNIQSAINAQFEKMTSIIPFSKLLFLMTKFLDGKEINELLCALINKFDNIADLYDTVCPRKNKKDSFFAEDYGMFKTSRTRARDMRIVKSFARMKMNNKTNKALINAAYRLLGLKDNAYKDKSSEYEFVLNNVLKSRRFFYVIKYTDPKKGRAIVRNRVLVELALKELPDTQIARYYKSVFGEDLLMSPNDAKKALIDKLTKYSSENFAIDEKAKALVGLYMTVIYLVTKNLVKVNARFAIAFSCFERDLDLMSDRLTLCKNDGINMLAITRHFIESDTAAFGRFNAEKVKLAALPEEQRKAASKALFKACKQNQHYKKHDYACVSKHLMRFMDDGELKIVRQNDDVQPDGSQSKLFINDKTYISPLKAFRNKIAHINVIGCFDKYIGDMKKADSYYGAYCYILQRMLIDEDGKNLLDEYRTKLEQYKSYNQDLMKLLCIPFAYNLPRYKNLSTEALFNLDTKKAPKES